jgi:hypothetical protein
MILFKLLFVINYLSGTLIFNQSLKNNVNLVNSYHIEHKEGSFCYCEKCNKPSTSSGNYSQTFSEEENDIIFIRFLTFNSSDESIDYTDDEILTDKPEHNIVTTPLKSCLKKHNDKSKLELKVQFQDQEKPTK